MSGVADPLGAAVEAFQAGRLGEAEDFLQQVLVAEPEHPDALHILGLIAVQAGQMDDAAALLGRALTAADGHPVVAVNLAAVLHRLGRFAESERVCRDALQKAPDDPGLLNGLGLALQGAGDGPGAVAAFAAACDRAPDFREAALNHAAALYRLGDADGAARVYGQALQKAADDPDALIGLGLAQAAGGHGDDAVATFRRTLVAHPDNVEALFNLAAAGVMTADERATAAALLGDVALDDEGRARLHFALGEALAPTDADASFRHLEAGNVLRQRQWAERDHVFDPNTLDAFVDAVITTFSADWFAARAGQGVGGERAVFIVGMPRSGSTLLERIIARHPKAAAGGELGMSVSMDGFPASFANAGLAELETVAAAHTAFLHAISPDAAKVTDKTPFNFLCLGVLAAAMPDARFLHTRRDPMAVGLSCFMQDFREAHVWAGELAHIGRYIRATERLMAHWHAVLPGRILDVGYEDLVADPQGQARRAVDFIGLDWDPACLDFHKPGGAVRTASVWAVHRPLDARAVDAWRRFEGHLGPLKDALGIA